MCVWFYIGDLLKTPRFFKVHWWAVSFWREEFSMLNNTRHIQAGRHGRINAGLIPVIIL
jgi:hypothetical protein